MASLGKLWAGKAYGTNTGNLAISFEKDEEELEGTVRFADDQYGIVVFKVSGTYGDEIVLTGDAVTETEDVKFGKLSIKAALTPEGSIRGEWSTDNGTGGPFTVHPHGAGVVSVVKTNLEFEQIYTQAYTLGALRLARNDVLSLLDTVSKDFNPEAKLIVTYRNGGAEIARYSKDFVAQMDALKKLTYLKLFIQEPDEFGINKVVMVELIDHGVNRVVVQGVREIWVEGKAQTLRSELTRNEKSIATNFKRFGFNLSQLALFVMIVAIVDVPSFWKRVGIGVLVLALIKLVDWLHVTFIPNATIRLTDAKDNWVTRWGSSMLSWFSTLTITILGGVVVYWLTVMPKS